jgi:hypothetical protein
MAEGVVYKVAVRVRKSTADETRFEHEEVMLVRAKTKAGAKNFAAGRCITVEPLTLDEGMKLALAGHKVEEAA